MFIRKLAYLLNTWTALVETMEHPLWGGEALASARVT
jgi:hypothetical protein